MPSYKTGFIVHDTKGNPNETKARILTKVSGFTKSALQIAPAKVVHNYIMPHIPVSRLRMGSATNVESPHGKTDMVFWAVPYDPVQIRAREAEAIRKIVEAGLACANEGAKMIGLGAFTSIIGNGGIVVAQQLNAYGIHVTTGDSYTAGSAVDGIISLANRVGYDVRECTAVVIGAGGATGGVAAQLLAQYVKKVIVVGRGDADLYDLVHKIGPSKAEQMRLKQAVCLGDLIITVTSATNVLDIDPRAFKSGAVVCDVARPRDIGPRIAEIRRDVLVFDGAIIKIPGDNVVIDWDFGFPKRTTFACMAEGLVLGMEGYHNNYSIGKTLDLYQVREICNWAYKHGFDLAGYRSFDLPLDDTAIDAFREFVVN